MTIKDDLHDAAEAARDHGKQEGSGDTPLYRSPSVQTIMKWIKRTLREMPDTSVTIAEILEDLGE